MKIYISGPITGTKDYLDKFEAAEAHLRELGHLPMHSARLPAGFDHQDYLTIRCAMIDICGAICMLPDWIISKEADLEKLYAELEGKQIMYYADFPPATGYARPKDIMDAYNRICTSLPKATAINDARRRRIKARKATQEEFERIFEIVEKSDFLTGRAGKRFKCNLDWILKPENWTKISEGCYNETFRTASSNPFTDYSQTQYCKTDLADIFIDLSKV